MNNKTLIHCPACGRQVLSHALRCASCGSPLNLAETKKSDDVEIHETKSEAAVSFTSKAMLKSQSVGLAGSLLLLAGVSSPILENLDYPRLGRDEGVIILFLSLMNILFVHLKTIPFLWITGFGSISVFIYTVVDMDFAFGSFGWGMALLALGNFLVLLAASLAPDTKLIARIKECLIQFGLPSQPGFPGETKANFSLMPWAFLVVWLIMVVNVLTIMLIRI